LGRPARASLSIMAITERTFIAAPIADAGNRVIASPFQFAVDGTDNMRLSVANSLAGVVVALDGRFLDDAGVITAFHHTFTPTADRMVTSKVLALGKGFVLNLTCYASEGAPRIGQTFVKLDVIRGFSGATIALGTMLQGYITTKQALGWPGSPITSSLDGGGYGRAFVGSDPGPGTQIVETVPAGARWEVFSFAAELATSGTVITRQPHLLIDNGGKVCFRSPNPGTIGGAAVLRFYWAVDTPLATVIDATAPLAGIGTLPELLAGYRVTTAITNGQPGDNWGEPYMMIREWLEVDA
jgi:hypothetical protein